MKTFECPDCNVNAESCDPCYRYNDSVKYLTEGESWYIKDDVIYHISPYFPDSMTWPKNKTGIPNCCKECLQHPANGGSDTCKCILPCLEIY